MEFREETYILLPKSFDGLGRNSGHFRSSRVEGCSENVTSRTTISILVNEGDRSNK